jgi:chemotaxis protein histidine kinase CheA
MTNPLGAADFFALEAGECLDRLEVLITQGDAPAPAELLRSARALRGSALMANHSAIARAAAGFEGLARALRDRGRLWDASTRERAGQAVDELRHLVRRVRDWSEGDAQRAARIAADLDALAGSSSGDSLRPVAAAEPSGVNTGVRAFVAREGALIASALDRAARALETSPESREPLYAVLRRMQSLRGLAEIGDLTPLPEILDGIELAVGDLTRLFAPPPGVSELLDAAAAALTRVSRDVADQGRPGADPPEARRFTELLLRAFATEQDVLPIESLYREGDADPMQRSIAQPQFSAPSPLGAVELVSYGEHLTQAADRITGAGSATARDLRLYALVSILRSVAVPGPDPVTPALARFGRAARSAIGSGAAAAEPEEFGGRLREAGRLLSGLAENGVQSVAAERLGVIAVQLDAARAAEEPDSTLLQEPVAVSQATVTAPPDADADVVPVESLAFDGESAFPPREAPAPVGAAAEPPATVEAAAAGPDLLEPDVVQSEVVESTIVEITSLAPSDRLPLERAFDTYRQLMSTAPATTVAASAASVAASAPAGAAPAAPPMRRATDLPPVDIRSLCYSGRGALERAAEVRAEITRRLADSGDLRAVEPLLRELLDLVPLALDITH